MTIKVLIVDDYSFIRDALSDLFALTEDIEVAGLCTDGDEVLAAVEYTRPDVVLMDIAMPRMDGLTATRQVLDAHPEVRIVILTGALTPGTVCEAQAAGAVGYLLKDDDPADLPGHVRAVADGRTAWSPQAAAVSETGKNPAVAGYAPGTSTPYVDETPPEFR